MRGGEDSRIPAILAGKFDVCIRTYDFDPEIAHRQIALWVEEFSPDVVVGESMGATHALAVEDMPILLVSPALNVGKLFSRLALATKIPGVRPMLEKKYAPRSEKRQKVRFEYDLLRKWEHYRDVALGTEHNEIHAFFGAKDSYRRSGVVSIKTYSEKFGDRYTVYDGTHYMEEEYIESLLIPAILNYKP